MSKQNKRIFEFGPFSIDTLNRQLLRDGEVVPLKAKAVDTLLLLIESHGDVIEKDDLMKTLWPDSFVEDSNLTQNIYTLRKALGGDYIETIPRRGYRFTAPVKEDNGAADVIVIQEKTRTSVSYEVDLDESVAPAGQVIDVKPIDLRQLPPAQTQGTRRWLWIGAVVILITIAVLAVFFLLRTHSGPFESIKLAKFTTTGKAVKVGISPDGRYVAYVLSDSGLQSIRLRQMATGKELQIVAPERTDIYGVTFSRDGEYVFYVSQTQNNLAVLYQVPSLGGPPDKLIEDVDSPVTLSPNGKHLAFLRFRPGAGSIIITNADGSDERTAISTRTTDPLRIGPNGVLPPSWSPDGDTIACPVSINGSQWEQAIYVYNLKDGSFKQVTEAHWPAVGRIEWSPDGHGIFATILESYSTPEQQIWFIPYPKGAARRITNDLADYRDLSVTADGRTLITVQSEKKANIWLARADDLEHPTQLTATSYDGLNGLSWTPDDKLVYTSQIAGEQNIWITDPNHSEPKQLTAHAGFNEQPMVSPDGRYIVLLSNRNGQQHLWRIDIDGKHPLELSHGKDAQATFTGDGQSLIFRSLNARGSNLVRVSIEGGEPSVLTDRIAFDPNISPDGKTIACAFRPEPAAKTQIALLPIAGGEPKFISDLPACYGRLRWMPDGGGIAYAARQEGVGNIWAQPLDGSPPKQLTHWGTNPIFSFGWSRDGKWLAYASGSVTSDVIVITDKKN